MCALLIMDGNGIDYRFYFNLADEELNSNFFADEDDMTLKAVTKFEERLHKEGLISTEYFNRWNGPNKALNNRIRSFRSVLETGDPDDRAFVDEGLELTPTAEPDPGQQRLDYLRKHDLESSVVAKAIYDEFKNTGSESIRFNPVVRRKINGQQLLRAFNRGR